MLNYYRDYFQLHLVGTLVRTGSKKNLAMDTTQGTHQLLTIHYTQYITTVS